MTKQLPSDLLLLLLVLALASPLCLVCATDKSPPVVPPIVSKPPPSPPPVLPPIVSKPPPSPYPSKPPPPFTAVVTGNVYCDVCKDGHFTKPLKGVTVGVFCWNGKSEDSFYGTTDDKGNFKIELKGFDYVRCGAKACAAKLISAAYTKPPCTQPTDMNGGQKGAQLKEKSKSKDGVILEAGPFSYTPTIDYPKCHHGPVHGTSPPYKSTAPPPHP